MLTGNAAAAWGARLADVDYIPAFPITPQTEIIETLSGWVHEGVMAGRFVMMDSEHAMMTAAGAAAATGARVFTATSSQGLVYAMEVLYTVAGWRVPLVLVNVSRGLSAPITLEADHNDVLGARDTGFLQIHAETCQEVLDAILMGYRIAEDPAVQLPVLVNMDGFTLSFTREPVEIPDPERVAAFLPAYRPVHAAFKASAPMAQGVAVLGGSPYSYFRYQTHLAAMEAIDVHRRVAEEYAALTGRYYDVVDAYRLDDAEDVFVMSNALAARGKVAVDRLRDQGRRVGLLRLRLIRPLPAGAIAAALAGRRSAIVVDQNLSPGRGGILFQELAAALYNEADRPRRMASFVGGLGGRDLRLDEFAFMLDTTLADGPAQDRSASHLLYTEEEWRQTSRLLTVAGKEVPDDGGV
jgi:pyruvate ferredoxin oxidoreductase alpha subunit